MLVNLVVTKIFLVYLYIFFGYLLRRVLRVPRKFVARSLFFIFIPIIVFKSVVFSPINTFLSLVFLSFFTSLVLSGACLIFWKYFKSLDISQGVFQCCYSYFNIGWFGIPIVYAFWGEQEVISMTAFYVGGMLFGHTVGFSLINKEHNAKSGKSRFVLFKNPSIYAIILGFLYSHFFWVSLLESRVANFVFDTVAPITSILGMGLLGMSFYGVVFKKIRWKIVGFFLLSRLALSLSIVGVFVYLLMKYQLLTYSQIQVYALIAILPIAINLVVFTYNKKSNNKNLEALLLSSTIFSCLVLTFLSVFKILL